MADNGSYIIIFDGECILCNRLVQFLIRRDPEAKFRFGTLQSEIGKGLLRSFRLPEPEPDSVVYLRGEQVYLRSAAALKILQDMGGIWKLLHILVVFPHSWRDHLYNYVAKNRFRWFGKKDSCMVPTAGERHRFLATDNPPVSADL
jgi:predicted DCC family thiol-disulfide oxidoreductase YuxK